MNKEIIQCITDFIKGGDESNLDKLNKVLHNEYRNIQSGFFSEKGLFIIDKEKYLTLIRENTFGGIPRTMKINLIEINGDIAYAKIVLESEKMVFNSLITLIKENENWYIIGNYPHFDYKAE
ncbi:hypothetical protein D1816_11470 [Aquimarina sp. AD10]|uniref:Uncharacterized protein n=1 Tax=Aquimarina aggregata TaxID=1642818 RepID=A0A162YC94_9FLAO|nr:MULTISPECIES: nuclear transport factor 2 family protein [Aquimarina]AXT60940.1 hypothetical protein D1816_11470 [Aquimarina sp. AD10]KZS39043.1 hypothetical protein AWE51_10790 [Aquimarina aggregata]RKM95582.1 hypothetical protein D7033_16945 [Aquimarina sp. AD10]